VTDAWPFPDPENCAVITIEPIVRQGRPILHVVHDEDDGGWQFLGWEDAREEDAMIVALKTVVQLDSSVRELADLPPGWRAWRTSSDDAWQRARA
jgi:hypothetical protein